MVSPLKYWPGGGGRGYRMGAIVGVCVVQPFKLTLPSACRVYLKPVYYAIRTTMGLFVALIPAKHFQTQRLRVLHRHPTVQSRLDAATLLLHQSRLFSQSRW